MTIADLKVAGVDYKELIGIEIFEKAHDHGICTLTGIVADDFDPKLILNWNKTPVTVKADKDIIFGGLISRCKLDERIGAKILTVTALSLSCKLAQSARSSMTFQSAKKKLSEVLSTVEKANKPAEINCWQDNPIADFIYRDRQTDWEFLTGIAERCGQMLFVDSKTDKLRVSVGVKAFNTFDADDTMTLLRRSVPMDFYKRLEQNTYEGARSCYFTETDLLTFEPKIGVGSAVNYENAAQTVIASHVYLHKNVLYNAIKLRHAEGCRADAWDVMKHFDRFYYLNGKVLEAKDTDVKVQFDVDEKQSKDEALDIPYESPVSNYLYTMPDANEKVFVYVDRIRQAAMGSLRSKEVGDKYTDRSFKIKNAALLVDEKKTSFAAGEKVSLVEEGGIKLNASKNIIFSSKGDIIIQSAQGLMPDNQLIMAAAHMAGYARYLAGLGQPPSVQFNPAGSTVGKVDAQIKNAGAKKETVELSDLAKELDKLTGRKNKSSESKSSGGGSGGKIILEGKKGALLEVKDSSLGMEGKNLNVKTRALMQVGYIPMPGGGRGSLSKFEGGNPKNRSEKITVEHGAEDRSRSKEKVEPTADDKNISR